MERRLPYGSYSHRFGWWRAQPKTSNLQEWQRDTRTLTKKLWRGGQIRKKRKIIHLLQDRTHRGRIKSMSIVSGRPGVDGWTKSDRNASLIVNLLLSWYGLAYLCGIMQPLTDRCQSHQACLHSCVRVTEPQFRPSHDVEGKDFNSPQIWDQHQVDQTNVHAAQKHAFDRADILLMEDALLGTGATTDKTVEASGQGMGYHAVMFLPAESWTFSCQWNLQVEEELSVSPCSSFGSQNLHCKLPWSIGWSAASPEKSPSLLQA